MELTFGEKIRMLREKKELNQTEFGKQVHMTQRKISYIENNRYEPSMADIREFCLFFEISADFLLELPKKLNYPDII